jgi:sterol desaturase/sphingolipid hydroxylase (fatty acid hydroxylase superfamily)
LIASPRFHRWHHTDESEARDKNFAGLLPAWDILFGTYYMPADRRPTSFGTVTPVPDGLLGQLTFPFRSRRPVAAAPRDQTAFET